jgi:hypothetical protein
MNEPPGTAKAPGVPEAFIELPAGDAGDSTERVWWS